MADMINQETQTLQVGDQVVIIEKSFGNEYRQVTAKIIEARVILGQTTFVVETHTGKRKVVGPNQITLLQA